MKNVRILYAEDDETLAFLTRDNLEQNDFEVTHCVDGSACLELFQKQEFDICILDIMLPQMDGFELATEIRKINPDIPLIFLSSKSLKEDRIKGLKLGADDYLVKPFSIEELVLKIEVFLRRTGRRDKDHTLNLTAGKYIFDKDNYKLVNASETISLTQREAELLGLFLLHKEQVLKREFILKQLWGDDDYFMGRSLDVFVSRLRRILSADRSISIQNLNRIGFRYSEKGD